MVIKSRSDYLVNSMTGPLQKWASNDWKTATNTPVKNRDLWRKIICAVTGLEALGAVVQFWLVPREENKDADKLANIGLSEDVRWSFQGLKRESD